MTLSSALTVSDVDNQTQQSAKVSISSGFLTGDVLSANVAGTSITASYDPTTGVLTLSGNDTLAHYRQVLDSVTYNSTSSNATNFGADTSRTISWVVNDGTLNSAPQTTTLTITAQDAAPALSSVAPSASYTAVDSNPASSTPVTLSSALTVSDVDNQTQQSAKVSISSGFLTGDVLSANVAGTSITASYDPTTGVLTLSGNDTLAHYRQVLDSVTYNSTSSNATNFGADTSRTISWVVNDGTLNSAPQTTTLTITAQDAAPALSNVAATASYAVGGSATDLSPGTTVTDVDNTTLASATVSISSPTFLSGDKLGAVTTGTGITASYNSATGALGLTGTDTLSHYQQVLESVTYSSTSADPTNSGADPTRMISWTVNDGTLPSSTQTTTLTIGHILSGNFTGNISGGTYTIQSNTTLSSGTISGSPTFNILSPATLTVNDTIASGSSPTFDVSGGATLDIGTNVSGATITIEGSGITNDNNNITAASSIIVEGNNTVSLGGNLTSTFITIEDTATVVLTTTNNLNAQSTVTFATGSSGNNLGTLVIDNTAAFKGTINGFTGSGSFSTSDKIDLQGFSTTGLILSWNQSSGVLTVTDANHTGNNAVNLSFAGSYTNASFHADSNTVIGLTGGIVIYDPPPPTIDSGTILEITAASAQDVLFANNEGLSGLLVLDHSMQFTGQVSGFTGTTASSDAIDLKDINFVTAAESYAESSDGIGGTLTVSDGANTAVIHFSGNYVLGNFEFASDGQGGTLITDPPVAVDQTGATDNTGAVLVNDGATLPLSGTVDNTGTITLASTGDATNLLITDLTLQWGGQVVLSDNSHNVITGTSADVTLTNIDITISGAGHLGNGQLTLINAGTIIADGNNALVIDTGANVIANSGTLQSTGSGGLVIDGDVSNSGLLWADGGNLTVHGNVSGAGSAIIDGSAVLEFTGTDSSSVIFHSSTGTLQLDHSSSFTGTISGFGGDGTLAGSDHVDLKDVNFNSLEPAHLDANGVLTVSDGVDVANLHLNGSYQLANFEFADDGEGGTLVYDPPIPDASTADADAGTAGAADSFAFKPHLAHDMANELKMLGDAGQIDHAFFRDFLNDLYHTNGQAWPAANNDLTTALQTALQQASKDHELNNAQQANNSLAHNDGPNPLTSHGADGAPGANGNAAPFAATNLTSHDFGPNHDPSGLGTPGSDSFVFASNFGRHTIADSSPALDLSASNHASVDHIQEIVAASAHDLAAHIVTAAGAPDQSALQTLTQDQLQHLANGHWV